MTLGLVFGTTSSHRCLATQQDRAHSTGVEESLLHLLLACPFTVRCWGTLHLQVGGLLDPFDILVSFKNQHAVPFFLELLVCMSWGIWTVSNDFFKNRPATVQRCKSIFREEFAGVILRAKEQHRPQIRSWLDAYVEFF